MSRLQRFRHEFLSIIIVPLILAGSMQTVAAQQDQIQALEERVKKLEKTPWTTIIISGLSLIVAAWALYLREVQRSKIAPQLGSAAGICSIPDRFEIYIPITFFNTSQQLGIVSKCSIVLRHPARKNDLIYIEWAEFRKLDSAQQRWVRDELAGPITIDGRKSITKMVYFRWTLDEITVSEGQYQIELVMWHSSSSKPFLLPYKMLNVSARDVSIVNGPNHPNGFRPVAFVPIDYQTPPNKVLTEFELRNLIG